MEQMNAYKNRDGELIPIPVSNNKVLENMFGNVFLRFLLKLASSRWYSSLQRAFLSSPLSTYMISGFVKKNGIVLSEYERHFYHSFNDFFIRSIKPGKRTVETGIRNLVSPSDCKASAYKINENSSFLIKGVDYTVEEVLQNKELAEHFDGGYFFLLRLCVEDYHHYIYPMSGLKSEDTYIPGALYTVHPLIHKYTKVYKENSRVYCTISNAKTTIAMSEVGALGVGRIVNDCTSETNVYQGEEKGHFEFGGSTILILVPKNSFVPRFDLLKNTEDGYETIVKMGECIGNEDFTGTHKE